MRKLECFSWFPRGQPQRGIASHGTPKSAPRSYGPWNLATNFFWILCDIHQNGGVEAGCNMFTHLASCHITCQFCHLTVISLVVQHAQSKKCIQTLLAERKQTFLGLTACTRSVEGGVFPEESMLHRAPRERCWRTKALCSVASCDVKRPRSKKIESTIPFSCGRFLQ